MAATIGVYTLVGGFMRSIVQPAMSQFMDDVKDGRFDFALLKPVDAQLLVSTRQVGIWQFTDVVVGLGIIVYAARDFPRGLGAGDVAIFIALLFAGSVIAYCFWLALCCAAFWVVEMPFMANDRLDPDRSHGDLLLTIQAEHSDTVLFALRQLMRRTRRTLLLRWTVEGFNRRSSPTARTTGSPRMPTWSSAGSI